MDLNEEKRLIKLAQNDPALFAEIFDRYYPKILGYVLKRTADLEVAQDVTSETFFKALKKLWQFRWHNVPFSSWLYKIAVNEINQYFRNGAYRSASLDELQEQGLELVSACDQESEFIEAQEELDRHESFLICRGKISRLDIKYQEVITLRFFEQKRIKEIGEILGKSDGTIKSLLHRGLEKLRELMAEASDVQPFAEACIVDSERSLPNHGISQHPKS